MKKENADPIFESEGAKKLRELAAAMQNTLPLMEGRDKGDQDDIIGEIVTVTDYGFMKSDKGEYVAYTVKEYPKNFFFGGGIMTEYMQQLDSQGAHDLIVDEGMPMLLTKKKSKDSGRTYTAVKFYPEV